MHKLAARAGVRVPQSRLERLTERYGTFCVARFDRLPASRRMFASPMTLLERQDGELGASYLDLAEFISDHGAQGHIDDDLAQLFRRVAFNVLVANRDDHLRNHGFIREATGWRVADAFDMNPSLAKSEHALTMDGSSAAPSIKTVLETAEFYRLAEGPALTIVEEVRAAVSGWRDEAKRQGLQATEIKRMESVFQG